MLQKIISGGQTGVDRAALDAALEEKFPCGGWCPCGRKAEDGIILSLYPLKETTSSDYDIRTEYNVKESDATLIITYGLFSGGTALTLKCAQTCHKPYLIIDLTKDRLSALEKINFWIQKENISTLNIAGPRESKAPGIYQQAKELLKQLLKRNT